jgi:DNA-binding NarL/FixJ family response regulator
MKTISVLVVEDHAVVREGIVSLLKQAPSILVVGEAENGRLAMDAVRELHPDVVVMDIAMPLLNGLEATRQILQSAPETKILILSAHGDPAYVEKAMEWGASGYLIKQSNARVLANAIRTVHRGKQFFSASIEKRRNQNVRRSKASGKGSVEKTPALSPREMEVLQLVAEGKANKETAEELHISIKTVEKHRQSVMEKLNIHDTASLTRYAISTGVIECSVQVTIT